MVQREADPDHVDRLGPVRKRLDEVALVKRDRAIDVRERSACKIQRVCGKIDAAIACDFHPLQRSGGR